MPKNSSSVKVALVTGAARRIGAEISRVLHDAGMNIVLHYNASEEEAMDLCEQLNQKRANSAVIMGAELQEAESDQILVERAAKVWGRLDTLVNNASRFYRTEMGKVTEYAWDDLMACNFKAPFFLAQAAAPYIAKHKGCIVNITDIHAERPLSDYSVYCLSKTGLFMMTKVLAKELGPDVRVNAVAPGSIVWPEGDNKLSNEDKQKIVKRTALQRSGSPKDIADTVLFLVQGAEYITGQVIDVDGGRNI
jgi:pteridine reductase